MSNILVCASWQLDTDVTKTRLLHHCSNIMSIKYEANAPLKQEEKKKEIILHVVGSVLVFDVMSNWIL